jgi:hypothetical protein
MSDDVMRAILERMQAEDAWEDGAGGANKPEDPSLLAAWNEGRRAAFAAAWAVWHADEERRVWPEDRTPEDF